LLSLVAATWAAAITGCGCWSNVQNADGARMFQQS
jgi:hypothetical protein